MHCAEEVQVNCRKLVLADKLMEEEMTILQSKTVKKVFDRLFLNKSW